MKVSYDTLAECNKKHKKYIHNYKRTYLSKGSFACKQEVLKRKQICLIIKDCFYWSKTNTKQLISCAFISSVAN